SNIIYYLLIKNKRVIRSILTLEVYGIVNNINFVYTILIILKRITIGFPLIGELVRTVG
ncbi:aurora kinase 2 splicing, partial [Colletotrichum cuscutae]